MVLFIRLHISTLYHLNEFIYTISIQSLSIRNGFNEIEVKKKNQFQNQSTKLNSEATCAEKCDDQIGDDSDENEVQEESFVRNESYRKSIVDNDDDLLHFEGGSTDEFMSPNKIYNNLSRYQNNIMAYVSPSTKRLHDDILRTSPSRVRHHNAESLRASRKNMISIIDYIILTGEIEEDPQSAIMFDDMEKIFKNINWNYNEENHHKQTHHHVRE